MKKIVILITMSTALLTASGIIEVGKNGKFINPSVVEEPKVEEDETPTNKPKAVKQRQVKKQKRSNNSSVEDKDMADLFGK